MLRRERTALPVPNGCLLLPCSPSRTGPLTLRMIRRFWGQWGGRGGQGQSTVTGRHARGQMRCQTLPPRKCICSCHSPCQSCSAFSSAASDAHTLLPFSAARATRPTWSSRNLTRTWVTCTAHTARDSAQNRWGPHFLHVHRLTKRTPVCRAASPSPPPARRRAAKQNAAAPAPVCQCCRCSSIVPQLPLPLLTQSPVVKAS